MENNTITPDVVNAYINLRKTFLPKAKEVFDFFVANCGDYVKKHVSDPKYWNFSLDENWFIVTYVSEYDIDSENDIEILMQNMYDETWKEYLLKTYK